MNAGGQLPRFVEVQVFFVHPHIHASPSFLLLMRSASAKLVVW
jgi:hypothetical protein